MGSVLSSLTDAIGLTNPVDTSSQDQAQANANRIAQENLDFQRQLYADWTDTYGDIQESLGEYFSNLSAEQIVTTNLQQQQQAHQQSQQQTNQNLAQRGISDSNFAAYLQSTNDTINNSQRATIRASGEQQVAEQQSQFLSIGLGQQNQLTSNISSASAALSNTYANQANVLNSQNQEMIRQNNEVTNTIIGGIAGGLV